MVEQAISNPPCVCVFVWLEEASTHKSAMTHASN